MIISAVMAESGEIHVSWFWNDRFWLPPNVTWAQLKSSDTVVYPQLEDFGAVLPMIIVLLVTRFLFERFVASPIGRALSLPATNGRPAEDNRILEKSFQSVSKLPDDKLLQGLAKQLDWPVRRVERWFRRRRNQERPSRLKKFSECGWQCVFYLMVWSYGMCTVPFEPWFWDTNSYFLNYPFHKLTVPISNYYLLQASFYISLLSTIFTDTRRKDFIAQLIHHISTLMLLGFSWVINLTRMGCLVILLHDVSDIFLLLAKMANYAKRDLLANVMFAIFAITFFITRVILYPLWIINGTFFVSYALCGPVPAFHAYYLMNSLIFVLYALHLYWFYTISRMAYIIIVNGKAEKDERSDAEENTDSCDETNGSIKTGNSNNHINTHSGTTGNSNNHINTRFRTTGNSTNHISQTGADQH